MRRRELIKAGAAAIAAGGFRSSRALADVPSHRWDGYDFGPGPKVTDRLNQGPFGIEQDQGWFTIASTTPSDRPVKNFGLGLVGYTWEESGPSLAARKGLESLEQHVDKLARLPFVDVLYIRCDWRDVQSQPGKLDLHPIWKLTFEAARQYNLRVAFRVQLSSPNIQPKQISMPDYLRAKVPLVKIGQLGGEYGDAGFQEPRYDNPEFQKAFRDLTELLAGRFDSDPIVEYVDMMQYGFWGEGHTSSLPSPFPDYLTAERTFVEMTRLQIESWKRAAIAVNTQPDISNVGNREVIDMSVRAGCWLRSDSILVEEPVQIEELSNRPPWLAVVMEDGYNRQYDVMMDSMRPDKAGVNQREMAMLHVLDLGANYWSLWTEADNLRTYHERYPIGFTTLQRRMGYRVRPSWVWQRKRYDTSEVIVAFANDGVAGVPGVLRVYMQSPDGRVKIGGSLDAGHPYGGKLRQASFILPKGLEGEPMGLRAEIETKNGVRRPVRWACAQPLNPDGSYPIQLKRHSDADWRKGV
ncbi:MAG TPA: hypothetical protein VE398_13610 [Acidobacteriota bacterium]|nr:hypothetical protein [Acidobacteriota bacterium]